jgi:hypothetical protein
MATGYRRCYPEFSRPLADVYSIRSDFGTFGISVVMRCMVDRNI